MTYIFALIGFFFIVATIALVFAVRDSMPAPHWVEEDELHRHNRGWYK